VASRRTVTLLRLGLLALIVASLLIAARLSGLGAHLTAAGLRETIQAAGTWGAVVFIGVFTVGQLAYVPGTVFYVASVFAYGRVWGGAISYVASLISVSVSFALVRAVGGQPLAAIESPRWKRLLAKLDERPLAVMFVLRTFFWTAPALNYSLALTRVRFPQYLASTAAGLVLPLIAISALYDVFFH
jgi:uncharacterized membrane protein YdjX (TVP38/TMEM64 family)